MKILFVFFSDTSRFVVLFPKAISPILVMGQFLVKACHFSFTFQDIVPTAVELIRPEPQSNGRSRKCFRINDKRLTVFLRGK